MHCALLMAPETALAAALGQRESAFSALWGSVPRARATRSPPRTKFWLIGMGGGKRRQQHSQTRRLGFAQALRNASPTTPPAGNPVAVELKPPPIACANCAGPRCSRRWLGATARGLAHAWLTGCLLHSQISAVCLRCMCLMVAAPCLERSV